MMYFDIVIAAPRAHLHHLQYCFVLGDTRKSGGCFVFPKYVCLVHFTDGLCHVSLVFIYMYMLRDFQDYLSDCILYGLWAYCLLHVVHCHCCMCGVLLRACIIYQVPTPSPEALKIATSWQAHNHLIVSLVSTTNP